MHIYFDVGTVGIFFYFVMTIRRWADSHVSKQRMALSKPVIHQIIILNSVSVCLLSVITYLRKITLLRHTKKQAALLYSGMIKSVWKKARNLVLSKNCKWSGEDIDAIWFCLYVYAELYSTVIYYLLGCLL